MKLSKEQRRIVQHTQGPALVVAGPGTGKSSTLLHRVQHLIQKQQVDPKRILLLTFSTSTEDDLKARLLKLKQCKGVETRTLHSFCYALINQNYPLFGYTQPPQYVQQTKKTPKSYKKRVEANRITFNDMLALVADLMKNQPETFQRLIKSYQHILVDEVQDLNADQTFILLGLARSTTLKSLIMVGDCKQLIYSFQGASTKHWEALSRQPEPTLYSLSITYRLNQASLGLINAVGNHIAPNDPPLLAPEDKTAGLKPRFKSFTVFDQQVKFIADRIHKLLAKGVPAEQIACLAPRIWNLQRLGWALANHGIAGRLIKQTQTSGEVKTRQPQPVQALIDLLTITQAINALGPQPRPNSVSKQLRNHAKPLERALRSLKVPTRYVTSILHTTAKLGINGITIPSEMRKLYNYIHRLKHTLMVASQQHYPEAAAAHLITAITPFLRSKGHKREEYQQQLVDIKLQLRNTMWDEYKETTLTTKTLSANSIHNTIHLCHSHGAKGREWEYVFLIDVVDGMFPDHKALTEEKKQEALRVFYVSITRHKRRLFILQSPVPLKPIKKNYKDTSSNPSSPHRAWKREDNLLQAPSPYLKKHMKHLNSLS